MDYKFKNEQGAEIIVSAKNYKSARAKAVKKIGYNCIFVSYTSAK
jgi:hypothetical protein